MIKSAQGHVFGERDADRPGAGLALTQEHLRWLVEHGVGELIVPGLPRAAAPFRIDQHRQFLGFVRLVDDLLPDEVALLGE